MIKQFKKNLQLLNKNLKELIDKFSKNDEYDADDQKIFQFEFFTGGSNPKFYSFLRKFGLTTENSEFLGFLQSDYCKEVLHSNDLKIHIETGNI